MARILNHRRGKQELGEHAQGDVLMTTCVDSIHFDDDDYATDSEAEAETLHSATVLYMQVLEQPLPPEIAKDDDFKAWLWHSKALWRLQYARRKHYQSLLGTETDSDVLLTDVHLTATKLPSHSIDRESDIQGWLEWAKGLWFSQLQVRRQRRAEKLAQETEAPIIHPRKTGRPMVLAASTSSTMCPPSAIIQSAASPASELPALVGNADKNKPKRTPTSNPWTGRGRVYLRNPVTGSPQFYPFIHLIGMYQSSQS
jgi:hypothetical protein